MTVINVPVNIGAPAARNWLMKLSDVKACDWAIYLDDDILLPRIGRDISAHLWRLILRPRSMEPGS